MTYEKVDEMRLKMKYICISTVFIFTILFSSSAQVRIRIFSAPNPEETLFTVTNGNYFLVIAGDSAEISKGTSVLLAYHNGKIVAKPFGLKGYLCDSVKMNPVNEDCSFSVRPFGTKPVSQNYTGSLSCYPDLNAVLLVNTIDIEQYIAGVVKTEGGIRQNPEYFKTQAVIARTFMYKNLNRHLADGYNLCDDTHCQAFNGISTEPELLEAARETHNLVILDKDSVLIYSAFHSNCGGETSTAEDVWLTNRPYLKRVVDPYCVDSRNAKWQKTISAEVWIDYLKNAGYTGRSDDLSAFDFYQKGRLTDYRTGSFSFPLQMIRKDLDLKSSFFSVKINNDSVVIYGRGYGHGVGLCQEGAMVMASKGNKFIDIINFYYSDVIVTDVNNAAITEIR